VVPSKRRPQHSRAKRQVRAVRRTPAEVVPHKTGLTTRAAVLGLVVCALVVSAALPLREYLSQRGQIAAATAAQEQAKARVAALQAQLEQLHDPAYVKAQARTRLHFVLPGETAYVLLTPSPAPVTSGQAAVPGVTAAGPESPWYSQIWSSVKVADRPMPTATPTPSR